MTPPDRSWVEFESRLDLGGAVLLFGPPLFLVCLVTFLVFSRA